MNTPSDYDDDKGCDQCHHRWALHTEAGRCQSWTFAGRCQCGDREHVNERIRKNEEHNENHATCFYCGDAPVGRVGQAHGKGVVAACAAHGGTGQLPEEPLVSLLARLERYGYALSAQAHKLNREARVVGEAITRLRLGERDGVILVMLAKAGVTPS